MPDQTKTPLQKVATPEEIRARLAELARERAALRSLLKLSTRVHGEVKSKEAANA